MHVWVDETRPRNQGSQLTAWELAASGVPHTLDRRQCRRPPDATWQGGHRHHRHRPHNTLRRRRQQDRHVPESAGGARQRHSVLRGAAVDDDRLDSRDGIAEIPIEERDPGEVSHVYGVCDGRPTRVRTTAKDTPISNFAFDVTPARLVSGLITERGICDASEEGLLRAFPGNATHMSLDEGYIKYQSHWTPAAAPDAEAARLLETWRRPLFEAGPDRTLRGTRDRLRQHQRALRCAGTVPDQRYANRAYRRHHGHALCAGDGLRS